MPFPGTEEPQPVRSKDLLKTKYFPDGKYLVYNEEENQ
jgi:hypothetical protein